jgi:hypothetical protein
LRDAALRDEFILAYGLFRCRTTAAACFFNNKNLAGTNQTNFVIVSINSPSKEGN